ncbi:urease accessory protein UreD [Kaistia dalseonensis]|uniref:Urease accessory protein UreD n=1 Tax=Kaistia dalseonensis TaxID=410840 RepID=A0ABU0H4K2_9HYPH|nr:urease accessory protein UreD [Kaistia dalseonensis]MCX5494658.1 urease accessory protein UreD [Kaistia dalseonensis]MDQ0437239.1 urease accessory protein [Kaistia dalseonensis]
MSAVVAANDQDAGQGLPVIQGAPVMQRAKGHARISFRRDGDAIRLREFHQQGCCKIRLPRVEPGDPPEAVLLNTSGGVTGGDHLVFEVDIGAGASAVVTTQAAERIYRRLAGAGRIENRLTVGAGARLDWLPQETILFDRSALDRNLEVDLAEDASALLLESIVFGRGAMGETVKTLSLADRWRVRRGGRLVFADGISIDGDAATLLGRGATGGGATAAATLVLLDKAAGARLEAVRAALEGTRGETGASAWGEILCVRFLAATSQILRQDIEIVAKAIRGRPMSRVWHC